MKPVTYYRNNSLKPLFESWKPFFREFDDLFENSRNETSESLVYSAACDVEENDNHYLLSFDLPGIPEDKIDIQVEGNQLTVSAERKSVNESKTQKQHVVERRYGTFRRTIQLPLTARSEQIEAQYKDGVLKIMVPKAEEIKPKKIKISSIFEDGTKKIESH